MEIYFEIITEGSNEFILYSSQSSSLSMRLLHQRHQLVRSIGGATIMCMMSWCWEEPGAEPNTASMARGSSFSWHCHQGGRRLLQPLCGRGGRAGHWSRTVLLLHAFWALGSPSPHPKHIGVWKGLGPQDLAPFTNQYQQQSCFISATYYCLKTEQGRFLPVCFKSCLRVAVHTREGARDAFTWCVLPDFLPFACNPWSPYSMKLLSAHALSSVHRQELSQMYTPHLNYDLHFQIGWKLFWQKMHGAAAFLNELQDFYRLWPTSCELSFKHQRGECTGAVVNGNLYVVIVMHWMKQQSSETNRRKREAFMIMELITVFSWKWAQSPSITITSHYSSRQCVSHEFPWQYCSIITLMCKLPIT